MELNIDPETFRLFQTGDPQAYQEIRKTIYLICKKRLRDASLAKTATDQILEKIRKYAEKIENIKAYLLATIKTTCLDMQDRREREEGHFQDGEEYIDELTIDEWHWALAMKEACEAAMEEAERLPKKLRRVFMMHYKEGLSVEEIVKVTQIPESTVYRRLDKAKKWVRNKLRIKGWKIFIGSSP